MTYNTPGAVRLLQSSMMKSLSLITILIIGVPWSLAQSNDNDGFVRSSSIYENPDYAHPRQALEQVVIERAKTSKNTFYVSRVHYYANGASNATVYWKEGRALILWEPHQVGSDRQRELSWSRRFLYLDKDVAPSLKEVGGSNYLITRAWAQQEIRDCVRHGVRFIVYKKGKKHKTALSNTSLERTRH